MTAFAREHHCGTMALLVRTLPRARSLQDWSEAQAEARAEAQEEARAGARAGGLILKFCSCELFLMPAHFKVARGRPKVKSVRKRGLERGRAARRRCSCELSLVRALFDFYFWSSFMILLASRLRMADQKSKA